MYLYVLLILLVLVGYTFYKIYALHKEVTLLREELNKQLYLYCRVLQKDMKTILYFINLQDISLDK
jgi:hypothetical protein